MVLLRHPHRLVSVVSLRNVFESALKPQLHQGTDDAIEFGNISKKVYYPGPKGLPLFGSLFKAVKDGLVTNSHEYFARRYEEYGPVCFEKFGGYSCVNIYNPEDMEYIFRIEGSTPKRIDLEPWMEHRRISSLPLGVLLKSGTEWKVDRSALNKYLLNSSRVSSHTGYLNGTADDLLLKLTRDRNSDDTLSNIDRHLFRWSIESAGTFIFGRRLGCLNETPDSDIEKFINSVNRMLQATEKTFFLPSLVAKIVRPFTWRSLCQNWDQMFAISKQLIESTAQGETGENLVNFLRDKSQFTTDQISANVTDLMAAATDTSSSTMQWIMYELSRNPQCQVKLREELKGKCFSGPITANNIADMPYLRAVIKETLRIWSVGFVLARVFPEDITLRHFTIPAGTVINMVTFHASRSGDVFERPLSFIPERWLDPKRKVPKFAALPFGFGARGCVGRRVAETEIQILLAKIMRDFTMTPVSNFPVGLRSQMLLVPKTPVAVKLHHTPIP